MAQVEFDLQIADPTERFEASRAWSARQRAYARKCALRALGCDPAALDAPIPGRDWAHTLFILRKKGPTPRAYPRKAGEAARSPL